MAYFIVTKFSDNKLQYNPYRLYCYTTSRLTELFMLGNCYVGEKFLYLKQFSLFSQEQKHLEKKSINIGIFFFISKSSEGGVFNIIES